MTFPVVANCVEERSPTRPNAASFDRIADTDALVAACDEPQQGRSRRRRGRGPRLHDGRRQPELIAGLNDDPNGMTVMVGIGGILAEAIRDVSFRLAPITEVDAAEMLDDLANARVRRIPR